MLILLVFGLLLLILSVFYLANSWQQYREWKWASFLVVISLAMTVYGAWNLPYWHHNSSNNASSSSQTSKTNANSLSSFSNNGLQANSGQNQENKEMAILRQLQKGYAKMGNVEYDNDSQTFKIEPSTDSDEGKALSAILNDPSQADQAGWSDLTKSLTTTSQQLKKVLGSGYSIMLTKPGDNNSAMFTVKDGHESYDAVKDN